MGDYEDPTMCVVQPLFWTSGIQIVSTSRRALSDRYFTAICNKSGCDVDLNFNTYITERKKQVIE